MIGHQGDPVHLIHKHKRERSEKNERQTIKWVKTLV